MENESGGEPGCSGLQNMKELLDKTRQKYRIHYPNDTSWPCPFCLHKAKTLMQCKIHISGDHEILTKKDIQYTLQSQISSADESESNNNFSQQDLVEFLKLIKSDNNDQLSMVGKAKCTRCGFIAKNSHGLKIHLYTCNKRSQSTQNEQQSSDSEAEETLIEKLMSLRSQRRIMNRIPKGARKIVCEEYSKAILECISENSDRSWEKLFIFVYNALQLPPKNEKRKYSLATVIRKNILNQDNSFDNKQTIKNTQSKGQLIRSAMNKLSNGDIKGSVRILSSDEVIAPYNSATLESLIEKHPKRVHEINSIETDKDDDDMTNEQSPVSRAEIIEGIRTFDNGSAGGIDGLRPQHLKDLICHTNGHLGEKLVDALGGALTSCCLARFQLLSVRFYMEQI